MTKKKYITAPGGCTYCDKKDFHGLIFVRRRVPRVSVEQKGDDSVSAHRGYQTGTQPTTLLKLTPTI